jgi:hypothetical protein
MTGDSPGGHRLSHALSIRDHASVRRETVTCRKSKSACTVPGSHRRETAAIHSTNRSTRLGGLPGGRCGVLRAVARGWFPCPRGLADTRGSPTTLCCLKLKPPATGQETWGVGAWWFYAGFLRVCGGWRGYGRGCGGSRLVGDPVVREGSWSPNPRAQSLVTPLTQPRPRLGRKVVSSAHSLGGVVRGQGFRRPREGSRAVGLVVPGHVGVWPLGCLEWDPVGIAIPDVGRPCGTIRAARLSDAPAGVGPTANPDRETVVAITSQSPRATRRCGCKSGRWRSPGRRW